MKTLLTATLLATLALSTTACSRADEATANDTVILNEEGAPVDVNATDFGNADAPLANDAATNTR